MILAIAGVKGGADISSYMDRDAGFEIDAAVGNRMDTLRCNLFDPLKEIVIPTKAEVWVYDQTPGGAVVDPPKAISAYNTYLNGAGNEVTSGTPSAWTPRLFAGFIAVRDYYLDGPQRFCQIDAQDYTTRLRSTVCNKAYLAGQSDQAIVRDLFATYRKDIDTTGVTVVVGSMPAISFPVHSLEQMMQRVVKISRAIYRVDYYKRLIYGVLGTLTAPFNLSDVPNGTTTFGYENLHYAPDETAFANQVWVLGASFLSGVQNYVIPPTLVNGTTYQFPLPGDPEQGGMVVKVNGVDQGAVGVAPAAGDITNPASFKNNVLIQHTPAAIAFITPPPAGQTVQITGKFRYPLVSRVSSPTLIAAANGQIFEAVLRDRRIQDLALAQTVGQVFLQNQGTALSGGHCVVKQRGLGGALLQPGQSITVRAAALFAGGMLPGGSITFSALITRLRTVLENDATQPYVVELNFSDRLVTSGY